MCVCARPRAVSDTLYDTAVDGSLLREGALARVVRSEPALGSCEVFSQRWRAGATSLETSWLSCERGAAFEQRFTDGARGTQGYTASVPGGWTGDHGLAPPIVAFPAFDVVPAAALRFVTWASDFCALQQGDLGDPIGRGLLGGPVVLFDDKTLAAVALAPANHVKHWTSFQNGSAWELGPSCELEGLPANFSQRTLVASADGPTAAIKRVGDLLLSAAGTNRTNALARDVTVNALGLKTALAAWCVVSSTWKSAS